MHAREKLVVLFAGLGMGTLMLAYSVLMPRALADAPPGRYAVPAPGEVEDTQTGLIWQQGDNGSKVSRTDANTYCNGLALNGHTWRIPNIKELQTLVDESKTMAIDETAFPDTDSVGCYWSSSPVYGTSGVGGVSFSGGNTMSAMSCRVRCVR
jgi:hypothetical protein